MADSGLDDNSCFFRDEEHGSTPRSPFKQGAPRNYTIESFRRKVATVHAPRQAPLANKQCNPSPQVVQYIAYVDGEDEEGGHGTHVVGSIVGQPEKDWATIQGAGC